MTARKYVLAPVYAVLIALCAVVLTSADYLGPDRTRTVVLKYERGTLAECNSASKCGGLDCAVCTWDIPLGGYNACLANECGPGGSWCGRCSDPGVRNYPHDVQVYESTNTINDPPVEVSGIPGCQVPGSNGWCRGGPSLVIQAREPVVGKLITRIEGSLGAGDFSLCDPPDAAEVSCTWVPPEGESGLTYWAHSTYGDTSPAAGAEMRVDTHAPEVQLHLPVPDGAGGWYRTPISTLGMIQATDTTSGIASLAYALDGGGWESPGSSLEAQGRHALQGSATDRAGNLGLSTVLFYNLDSIPPRLSLEIPPPDGSQGWYLHEPVVVNAAAQDETSGVAGLAVKDTGGAWLGLPYAVTGSGEHRLEFMAEDQAGNSAAEIFRLRIDTLPPHVSLILPTPDGLNGWHTQTVEVTAAGSDEHSGLLEVEVRLEDDDWQSSPLEVTAEGVSRVEAQAFDVAGNRSEMAAAEIKIDHSPPDIRIQGSGTLGQAGWYRSPVNVQLVAQDAVSGVDRVEFRVDTGDWQAGDRLSLSTSGKYTVTGRAVDRAGWESAPVAQSFQVDVQPPNGTISFPGEGAPVYGSVRVTGSAQDDLSGLARAEWSLDGTTWTSLTVNDGSWGFDWDTLRMPGSTLRVRLADAAGNVTEMTRAVRLANELPRIDLDDWWFIWQAGKVSIRPGGLPLVEACVEISDPEERYAEVSACYDAVHLPQEIRWNRRFRDGVYAPIGTYRVRVQAKDSAGRRAEAQASILVPPLAAIPPTEQPTETAAPPAVTRTPLPTRPAASTPTSTSGAVPTSSTPQRTRDSPIPDPTAAMTSTPAPGQPFHSATFFLIALFMAVGVSSLFDRRYKELKRLALTIRIIRLRGGKDD